MNTKVLFIGSFLSKESGTKSISEKFKVQLEDSSEFFIRLVSVQKNKIFRLLDIVSACAFSKFQIVHIDVFSDQAFYITRIASWVSKLRGKKIIMTCRGGKLPEFYESCADTFKKTLRRANHLQTPSKYLQRYFQNVGLEVNYLPNSINLKGFPYRFGDGKASSLLWVRAFSSIYNPNLAVRILHEVRKRHPDATLTMIGPDKGELKPVKELINRLGLQEAVSITGPVPNEQLYQYFHSHSVYLNTTSYESFGVAVMEAAACGTPIVSTAVGEIPLLWEHEKDILTVEAFTPEQFAEQINRIFSEPGLAQRLSSNARSKAEQFDWEHIKPQWIELLRSV